MKIRTRLLITSILLFSGGSYWLVDWVLQDFRYHYFMTMEESMVDSATALSSLVAQQTQKEPFTVSDEFRRGMTDAMNREFSAQIYAFTKTNVNLRVLVGNRRGIVLFDSDGGTAEGEDFSQWRDFRLTMEGKYGARATPRIKDDPDTLTFFVSSPVIIDGETCGIVSVAKPISSILPAMRKAKTRLIVTGAIAVSAVLLLQLLVSSWVTRPIRMLIAYARAVRDGQPATKPRLTQGEMGDLATAFEEMRDSLEGKEYVEQYVQTLTHEMKSPLAAIRGASELLGEEMTDEQRDRFLQNIRSESNRMHELIQRLLTLASLEKRKHVSNVIQINTADLLDDILSSMQPLFQKKQVSVIQTKTTPLYLSGEYFLLRQALTNLLQNALDFSPSDGKIHIETTKKNGSIIICVRDEGPGFPDYATNKIFDRFFSLPRPDSGKKSSGLGLNFVREIAKLHGGIVTLTNSMPKGAEATLRLPAAAA